MKSLKYSSSDVKSSATLVITLVNKTYFTATATSQQWIFARHHREQWGKNNIEGIQSNSHGNAVSPQTVLSVLQGQSHH